MNLCSIASGSSGNCTYIGTENTHLLLDAGITCKRIVLGLTDIGIKPGELDGILITHEHSDHIKGIAVLCKKYEIPIFATEKTKNEMIKIIGEDKVSRSLFKTVTADTDFNINDITIRAFNSLHDSVEPVGYTFKSDNKKIGFATDLGNYNEYIVNNLRDSNIIFLEANHDIRMLQVGPYPYFLKQRILSDHGHLSNERSGQLLCEIIHDSLKHIVLGHLSKENNYESLAFEAIQYEINSKTNYEAKDFNIFVANRDQNSQFIAI
ncbi:MAG: ribonuclease [Clostridiales bacterium]|nr:ribonuclease [Clostridiales bacterium]